MSKTKLIFYQDEKGNIPILEWLDSLPNKVQTKFFVKLVDVGCVRRISSRQITDINYKLRRNAPPEVLEKWCVTLTLTHPTQLFSKKSSKKCYNTMSS
jgi:hypothetical protein